mmetsp:Transcript_66616/g.144684  ORF Transcript_66616/g.144684 Transcript_66616/m.144684 type:complete len:212 (-) Transcript_66616:287-922(-)
MAIVAEEDVLGLQVSMNDVLAVQVLDRLQQLSEDCSNPLFGEGAEILFDLFLQVALRAELHHDDEVGFGLQGMMFDMHEVLFVADDVPMSQRHQLLGLLGVVIDLRDVVDQDLLRHELGIVRHALHEVHGAIATGPDELKLAILVSADAADAAPVGADLPQVDGPQDCEREDDEEGGDVVQGHDDDDLPIARGSGTRDVEDLHPFQNLPRN